MVDPHEAPLSYLFSFGHIYASGDSEPVTRHSVARDLGTWPPEPGDMVRSLRGRGEDAVANDSG